MASRRRGSPAVAGYTASPPRLPVSASLMSWGVAWRGSPMPRLMGRYWGLGVTSANNWRSRSNGYG